MPKSQFLDLFLFLYVFDMGIHYIIPVYLIQHLSRPEAAQAKIRQLQRELGNSTGVASGAAAGATIVRVCGMLLLLYETRV